MEGRTNRQTIDGWWLKLGTKFVAAGLLLVVSSLPRPAGANDDLVRYDDKVANVSAERSYNSQADQTTFTFTLELKPGTNTVSHVVIASCPVPLLLAH